MSLEKNIFELEKHIEFGKNIFELEKHKEFGKKHI